jgi:hypothetical protein
MQTFGVRPSQPQYFIDSGFLISLVRAVQVAAIYLGETVFLNCARKNFRRIYRALLFLGTKLRLVHLSLWQVLQNQPFIRQHLPAG